MTDTPNEPRAQEPQSERGDIGSRDTGSDDPHSSQTDRPSGSFDDDEVTSAKDDNPQETTYGGTGTETPGDAESAVPPYEGRQTSASGVAEGTAGEGTGANTAGAGHPVADSEPKAPDPADTPGGATASPAEEHPATHGSENASEDEGVEVAHQSGVSRAEDHPRESS